MQAPATTHKQLHNHDIITILGPTASGKTSLASQLAYKLQAEIISGDSRQVYKGMDIGTGKDLEDYVVQGYQIPYHLIDILDAGEKYNLYAFQNDFYEVMSEMKSQNKTPILCGGTGLYIESVLKSYPLVDVPANNTLRNELLSKDKETLISILSNLNEQEAQRITEKRRLVRAIEIEEYRKSNQIQVNQTRPLKSINIGVALDRETRRNRITTRLKKRIEEGMTQEVETLINSGISPQDLIYYGLEYKYVTLYVMGQISLDEMAEKLEIAIHQFAKRQMTWFRGMEKRGTEINWIDGLLPMDDKVNEIMKIIEEKEDKNQ